MKRSFLHPVFALSVLLLFAGCVTESFQSEPEPTDVYAGELTRSFPYTLDGENGEIRFTVYSGLNDYLASIPRVFYCNPQCPSNESMHARYLDNKWQKIELSGMTESIRQKSQVKEEQARIAISMVQQISYDTDSYDRGNSSDRYPYQVLYDNMGVCGEKARLMAYLLRDMGYGTALLYFPEENHAALGLKCPKEYSYMNTGYCFIEATMASIPTYGSGNYPGFGKLKSRPDVIKVSDGEEFSGMEQMHSDAREWSRLAALIEENDGILEKEEYDRWLGLAKKYGIKTG